MQPTSTVSMLYCTLCRNPHSFFNRGTSTLSYELKFNQFRQNAQRQSEHASESKSAPLPPKTSPFAVALNGMSRAVGAAIFAVGAAVGAGATALIQARRQPASAPVPVPVPPQTRTKLPERNQEHKAIVQVEPLGSQVVISPQLGEVLKYGNPGAHAATVSLAKITKFHSHSGPISDLLTRKAYIAAYDRRLRHPAWVRLFHFLALVAHTFWQTAEHLTLASLGKSSLAAPAEGGEKGDRTKSEFMEDESIPVPFRARLKDYFRSGYDRGHMYVPILYNISYLLICSMIGCRLQMPRFHRRL
jgi:hypothetical protein